MVRSHPAWLAACTAPESRSAWLLQISLLRRVLTPSPPPLPYPISEAGLVVGIWFLIGIIYLAYLLRRHPERVHDMDKVFD